MHGHLSLERICGPDPEPEFRYCTRCDIELKQGRVDTICVDCKGLNAFKPRTDQCGQGNFHPVDPAYEVALHSPTTLREDPTAKTLDAGRIPYFAYVASRGGELEFSYALSLFASDYSPKFPIVLITSHGKVVDFWDGFDLARLNQIPTAREAAINAQESFVPIREQAAA